ncbi:MAG: hypothetical protein WC696_02095 [Candidatus Methylopumilus sp.]
MGLSLVFGILTGDPACAEESNLGNLSLHDTEQLFRNNSRELLLAKRMVEGSQADTISAGQRPNPTLSLNSTNLSSHKAMATAA